MPATKRKGKKRLPHGRRRTQRNSKPTDCHRKTDKRDDESSRIDKAPIRKHAWWNLCLGALTNDIPHVSPEGLHNVYHYVRDARRGLNDLPDLTLEYFYDIQLGEFHFDDLASIPEIYIAAAPPPKVPDVSTETAEIPNIPDPPQLPTEYPCYDDNSGCKALPFSDPHWSSPHYNVPCMAGGARPGDQRKKPRKTAASSVQKKTPAKNTGTARISDVVGPEVLASQVPPAPEEPNQEPPAPDPRGGYFYQFEGDAERDYIPRYVYNSTVTGESYSFRPIDMKSNDAPPPMRDLASFGIKDWHDSYKDRDYLTVIPPPEDISEVNRYIKRGMDVVADKADVNRLQTEKILEETATKSGYVRYKGNEAGPERSVGMVSVVHAKAPDTDSPARSNTKSASDVSHAQLGHYPTLECLRPDLRQFLYGNGCGTSSSKDILNSFKYFFGWIQSLTNISAINDRPVYTLPGLVHACIFNGGHAYKIHARQCGPTDTTSSRSRNYRHYILWVKFNDNDPIVQETILKLRGASEKSQQDIEKVGSVCYDFLCCMLKLGVPTDVTDQTFTEMGASITAASNLKDKRVYVTVLEAYFDTMLNN